MGPLALRESRRATRVQILLHTRSFDPISFHIAKLQVGGHGVPYPYNCAPF